MYQIDKIKFLQIGVQGENDATNIEIDMASWVNQFPDAVFHILFKPYNASAPSPMLTTYADGVLTWTVGVGATAVVGVGYTEVRAQDASTGLIKKSRIIPTSVDNSVSGVEITPPASYQEWVTDVLNAGTDAKNSAAAAMAYSQGKQIKFEIGDDEDPDGMAGHLLFYFKDEEDEEWEDYLDLGPVDVYATAVAAGYTGTKAQWVQSINDAEANAQKSEKYAVGKVNGTDVGSDDPTYHNNSKYYSEQAAAAKTAAEAAQAAAETAAQTDLVAWLEQNITNPDSPPLDRTLSSSSSATPADITGELKSALDLMQDITLAWTDGSYVNNSGSTSSNDSYSYTDYIPVLGGQDIIIRSKFVGNAKIAIYKADKTVDEIVSSASSDLYDYHISLSADAAFVRFSSYTSQKANTRFVYSVVPELLNIYDRVKRNEYEYNGAIYGATGLKIAKFEPGIIAIPAIDSTGSLTRVPTTSGRYSAYYSITEGQDVYISASAGTTSYRGWAFLDSNYKVLDRVSNNNAFLGKLTAPENSAYVVVNSLPGSNYFMLVDSTTDNNKVDDVEKQLSNRIGQLQNVINIILNPVILEYESGIIRTPDVGSQTSLTRESSSSGRFSAYSEVKAGQRVIISASKGTNTVRAYAFLDSNLYVLSRSGTNAGSFEVTAPDGSAYVVSNSLPDVNPYAIIVENTQSVNVDSLNVGMFNRIGVCGYSWDSGYAYSSRSGSSAAYTRRSRSWGAVLANMYGIDFDCFGVPSGTTCAPNSPWIGTEGAKCWQTEAYGLPKLLADDPCDLYWFHMYGNDVKKLGMSYLGTIDDIKEDYTQNPDTFYGNYGRIMAQIKAHAPNALFIFTSRCKESNSATYKAFATALQEIGVHFGVPVIDWNDDSWFANWVDNHLVSNHPTFADYAGMAKAADRLFAMCAKTNWNYFKNFVPAADPN